MVEHRESAAELMAMPLDQVASLPTCTSCEGEHHDGSHSWCVTCWKIRNQQPVTLADHLAAPSTSRPWAETKLPVPFGYQEMHLEADDRGNHYLYMGCDYVAFTPAEWAEFLAALTAPGAGRVTEPVTLASHLAAGIDAILGG